MPNIFTGTAGEYFVAGELSRRGYIATITLRNAPHIDVLVSNGEKAVNVQVKTRCIERTRNQGWALGSTPLEYKQIKNDIYYVLVEISEDFDNGNIGYYIIPKKKLNRMVEENFQKLAKTPRMRDGQPRTTTMRRFRPKDYLPQFQIEKYKDNWDVLFK